MEWMGYDNAVEALHPDMGWVWMELWTKEVY